MPQDLPGERLQSLREDMAHYCGVVREADGLRTVLDRIDAAESEHGPARALIASRLIAGAALAREESRGGHFRSDFPDHAGDADRTFMTAPGAPVFREAS